MADDPPQPEELDDDPTRDGLKYYIFDWDDNVLHMPTEIILERRGEDGSWGPCSVSTSTFAQVRTDSENYRPPNGDWEAAFRNFRDLQEHGESAFLVDTRRALAPVLAGTESPAPSFHVFKASLIQGRLFAIVTARGHRPDSIRLGVLHFIMEALTEEERAEMVRNLRAYFFVFDKPEEDARTDEEVIEYYLDLNHYHGVTSPEFQRTVLGRDGVGAENPEEAKQLAIRAFVEHVLALSEEGRIDRSISFGFSDDDLGNVAAAREYIEGVLAREYPYVRFVVYDTSDPAVPSGIKTILQGQLELDLIDPPASK